MTTDRKDFKEEVRMSFKRRVKRLEKRVRGNGLGFVARIISCDSEKSLEEKKRKLIEEYGEEVMNDAHLIFIIRPESYPGK
jgi:uncharacterized protein (DUF302 family)